MDILWDQHPKEYKALPAEPALRQQQHAPAPFPVLRDRERGRVVCREPGRHTGAGTVHRTSDRNTGAAVGRG
jgi:hypothetical protein